MLQTIDELEDGMHIDLEFVTPAIPQIGAQKTIPKLKSYRIQKRSSHIDPELSQRAIAYFEDMGCRKIYENEVVSLAELKNSLLCRFSRGTIG